MPAIWRYFGISDGCCQQLEAFSRRKVDVATQSDLVFFYDGMITGDDFQRRLLEEVGGSDGLLSEYTGHHSAFVADTALLVSRSLCCPCTTEPCTESALVCQVSRVFHMCAPIGSECPEPEHGHLDVGYWAAREAGQPTTFNRATGSKGKVGGIYSLAVTREDFDEWLKPLRGPI